jgi:hypothetical protein
MNAMNETIVVQGRTLNPQDIARIRELIAANPSWNRRRLSEVLSAEWNWRNGSGRLKDMATRTLLVKLQALGLIQLPARRRTPPNRMAIRPPQPRLWDKTPIGGSVQSLAPLWVQEISGDQGARAEFRAALEEFHYLGFRGTVGPATFYYTSLSI